MLQFEKVVFSRFTKSRFHLVVVCGDVCVAGGQLVFVAVVMDSFHAVKVDGSQPVVVNSEKSREQTEFVDCSEPTKILIDVVSVVLVIFREKTNCFFTDFLLLTNKQQEAKTTQQGRSPTSIHYLNSIGLVSFATLYIETISDDTLYTC